MVNSLHLFATLQNGDGGLALVWCDGHQHFVFERSRHGTVESRQFSADPRDFHDYIKALSESGWSFAWAYG